MGELIKMIENFWTNFWIEFLGYVSLICFFSCIWVSGYRWQLFFTGLLALVIAILNVAVLNDRKKKAEK